MNNIAMFYNSHSLHSYHGYKKLNDYKSEMMKFKKSCLMWCLNLVDQESCTRQNIRLSFLDYNDGNCKLTLNLSAVCYTPSLISINIFGVLFKCRF